MREISLHILDVAENALRANAKLLEISVVQDSNLLTVVIEDDGDGMEEDFLKSVTSPYVTTREGKIVGLGIPLFKEAAELSGGSFKITSRAGVGTKVVATFKVDAVNRPPLGNIADTIIAVIGGLGDAELQFKYVTKEKTFVLDTRSIKKELNGLPVDAPEVLVFLRDMISENVKTKIRGVSL